MGVSNLDPAGKRAYPVPLVFIPIPFGHITSHSIINSMKSRFPLPFAGFAPFSVFRSRFIQLSDSFPNSRFRWPPFLGFAPFPVSRSCFIPLSNSFPASVYPVFRIPLYRPVCHDLVNIPLPFGIIPLPVRPHLNPLQDNWGLRLLIMDGVFGPGQIFSV